MAIIQCFCSTKLVSRVHNQTDESCLENASSIRIVLAELADKLSQASGIEAELNNALTRLMAKKNSQDTYPPSMR